MAHILNYALTYCANNNKGVFEIYIYTLDIPCVYINSVVLDQVIIRILYSDQRSSRELRTLELNFISFDFFRPRMELQIGVIIACLSVLWFINTGE